MAARTKRAPGSLTRGVPASVTRAIVAPAFALAMAVGVVDASLKRWCETRRGPEMAAWLKSLRARRVSSQ